MLIQFDDIKRITIIDKKFPLCQLEIILHFRNSTKRLVVGYEDTFMGDPMKYAPDFNLHK